MLTLAIDTSTSVLSVALIKENDVLITINEQTKNNQSEILMTRIQQALKSCDILPTSLKKIAVAIGPGSYTGVRVGVTVAKSLGYALNVPVIGVSSLEILAAASKKDGLVVALIDARRETVFAAGYENGEIIIQEGHYELKELCGKFGKKSPTFVTDKVDVHREIIHSILPNAQVLDETEIQIAKAEILAELSENKEPVANIHELVPQYLRKTEAEVNARV